jgi:phosphatidylserine decarboxylase
VYESIHAATKVWVKGKAFSLENLLRNTILASQFEGGSIALFRLAPQDYHRFHSPVSGVVMEEARKIAGGYMTVNPMAVNNEDVDVFTENVRKVTVIALDPVVDEEGVAIGDENGGDGGEIEDLGVEKCVFVSIGALLGKLFFYFIFFYFFFFGWRGGAFIHIKHCRFSCPDNTAISLSLSYHDMLIHAN